MWLLLDSCTKNIKNHCKLPAVSVTSTPNVSSESVEGLGGESPEKDWYVLPAIQNK